MEILRLAVIGSGGMGRRRAEQFHGRQDCRVTVIASRNDNTGPDLAETCGADWVQDWREALEMSEVDAVVVTTPNHLHGANILEALEAGRMVFSEYPICRHWQEADRLATHFRSGSGLVRMTHRELVSPAHAALKAQVRERGALLSCNFLRRTPGRGARPEVLFNLHLSGAPALFFVYHVYPVIDLFGPPKAVAAATAYADLDPKTQAYASFANSVVVHLENGGHASWDWAGGVKITQAAQREQILLHDGSLIKDDDNAWRDGHTGQPLDLPPADSVEDDLVDLFVREARGEKADDAWRDDGLRAVHAARVGLAAEISAREGRVVEIPQP